MSEIARAAEILRTGRLVAFPTETVYGLGADATNAKAVQKIFAAKGRPATNPLIVHVSSIEVAKRYTTHWSDAAQTLALRYWPGPLTLVLPKAGVIPNVVTGGGKTVGLRAPNHPVALELLRAFDGPVAAPSANRSNRVSPTTAEHVREELGDAVDLILDGGPCAVGIESTVLDLTRDVPIILRPGAISKRQLETVLGPVEMRHAVVSESVTASSPGQQAIHYAPQAAAYRVPFGEVSRGIIALRGFGRVGLIRVEDTRWSIGLYPQQTLPADPAGYARGLYAALREIDAALASFPDAGPTVILIEMPPDLPEWAAVRDRVTRATRPLSLEGGSPPPTSSRERVD